MANGTQTPTVVATPQGGNVAAAPGVTPPGTPTTGDPTGGLGSFLTGIWDIINARPNMNLASQYAGQATTGPASALDRMTNFLNDPSSIPKMPGYQFGMDQGIEAVNRGAGSSGMLNSGNRLAALQNFGQNYAGTWMDRMWQELMGNTQAATNVGGLDLNALQMLMQAQGNRNQQIGAGIGGIAAGIPAAINAGSGIWNAISQAFNPGGGGTIDPNVPNNTVPSGFNPWNSDVPPATDWNFGSDLPTGDMGLNIPPIDLGLNF